VPKSRTRRKPPPRRTARPPRTPLVAQPAPGVRGQVERTSAGVLVWLSSRPRFFVPLLSVALLLGGLFAPPGIGVPLLLLLAGLVAWLTYLSWPVVTGVQRLLRLSTLGLILAAVAGKLTAT
jgi:hypothetical protein